MALTISVYHESFTLAEVFRISRGEKTAAEVIRVIVSDGHFTGQGESVPYGRYGESIESVTAELESVKGKLRYVEDHALLPDLLKAGSARNALDCAFWDLRAKISGKSVAELTELTLPKMCVTAQTISVDSVENMQASARKLAGAPVIKVKLDPEAVVEKIAAIHQVTPNSQLIVDANEGWSVDVLKAVADQLKTCNVVLIEQPLPAAEDAALEGYECPIPLCADESCHTADNLETLRKRYQSVNIKLDKTGGLSEAIDLLQRARELGFTVMVGCMVGTSLAMAPAYLLCEGAEFVDLDGPLLIADDRPNGFSFSAGKMWQPAPFLWGVK